MQFIINTKKFDKLPADLKEIMVNAIRLSAYDMYIQNYDMNTVAWQQMKTEYPNIPG